MKPLDRESRRLLDEVSAGDAPAQGSEDLIWQSLTNKLDLPLPPTAAAASRALESSVTGVAASTAGVGAGVKLVVGLVAAGAIGVGSVVWVASQRERTPPVESRRETPIETATSSQPAGDSREAVKQAQPEPTAQAPAPTASNAASSPQPSAAPNSTLQQETQLLAAVQRALSSASPARALALIDKHRELFPEGDLAQEREAARVVALCALGRPRETARARRVFLRDWPDSPLAARVRAACVPAARGTGDL